ncbi:MAG TPA: 5-(carboxyamino)imidazole ribonucleotide synthase [Phycisphaerales bacterium]|nr:5-(carboxyamino)imidazole ribonucleotide synthase [Phycisphaerales bacterium]
MVGVLGGGQLGRMLAMAGQRLGVRCRFLDPDPHAPAGEIGELIVADYSNEGAIARLREGAAITTCEFENVPASAASLLERTGRFFPGAGALAAAQERLAEKSLFAELNIPTPRFAPIDGPEDVEPAVRRVGLPAVLKTRRLGYDGKGQLVLREPEALASAWRALGSVPLIAEELVEFEREVSLIAVRSASGETAFYPLIENLHQRGILRLSRAPAPDTPPGSGPALQQLAQDYARRVLDRLSYVGVLTIEFFQSSGAALKANEMACRVHNSGHWTIEGAECSQFENHLRAILGWPLGATGALGPSAMVNIIGAPPILPEVLRVPGAAVHLYGKSPRAGRKLGHITLRAPDEPTLSARTERVRAIVAAAEAGGGVG